MKLENYFKQNGYLGKGIQIRRGMFVPCVEVEFFVTQTINCLKAHKGNSLYMPYYNHLLAYCNAIIPNSQSI